MTTTKSDAGAVSPSRAIQLGSFLLPVLKCAVCPACLGVFGSLFAGARIGLLGDEHVHGAVIAFALVADFAILYAALRHHQNRWPLGLCIGGGILAVTGHLTSEAIELAGFGVLMLAAVLNVVALRRHRRQGGSCCAHDGEVQTRLGGPIHEHG